MLSNRSGVDNSSRRERNRFVLSFVPMRCPFESTRLGDLSNTFTRTLFSYFDHLSVKSMP